MAKEKNTKHSKFLVFFSLMAILFATLLMQTNSAEAKMSQDACIVLYKQYKELGEQKLQEKYHYKPYLGDCIQLYKNPNWDFAGKDKIDKNFEKSHMIFDDTPSNNIFVKITSTTVLDNGKHFVKFQACASKSIQNPSFVVESLIDKSIIKSSKSLSAGKCQSYQTQINAKNTAQIKIWYTPDLSSVVDLKSKKS